MKTWSEILEPVIVKLEVQGKFGGGVSIDPENAAKLAYTLKMLTTSADLADRADAHRWYLWQFAKEMLKCALVVGVFVLVGVLANG
jgi:hypothetical protein